MSKNKDKKANVKGLRSLLYNNKFVLLLSVILAFGIWIWVSIEKSPEVEVTISSVPVKIDMDNSVPAQLNLQIFGDNSYGRDFPVKRLMRDAKITQIYEGTNQAQRMVISNTLLK